jgi:hypothetical protein
MVRFWSSDKFISLTAFLISVSTFALYLYQTHLIQKQQYASVLPYLELGNSGDGDKLYKLVLVNNGIGPAFVRKVQVHYKGKSYSLDPARFYGQVLVATDTLYHFYYSNLSPGRVIPPGKEIELLGTTDPRSVRKCWQIFGSEMAKIEITYASVYGEEWVMNGQDDPHNSLQ